MEKELKRLLNGALDCYFKERSEGLLEWMRRLDTYLTEQERGQIEPLVSLQNAGWQVIKKLGNPPNSDRYLIVYRYKDMTELKYFIGDYDTRYGWSCELQNVEFIAWREIPKFDSASILSP